MARLSEAKSNRLRELWNSGSPSGKFVVVKSNGISSIFMATLELAQELADLMNLKHGEKYTVKER